MKDLVSIITPVYNGEKYITETIESVLNQSYVNWELIIVDDMSTDNTISILNKYVVKDNRIKYYVLECKGGASLARNKAIIEAKGKYIAFLDADDLWNQDKLEKQIRFMQDNNYSFTYHDYELIDENSIKQNLLRIAPTTLSYKRALFGCSIGCLSVIYNAEDIGLIQIPRIDKRNDDALWFAILERCKKGYKLNDSLALYRISSGSLSSGNKVKLIKYHYRLYRISRGFNPFISMFYVLSNIIVYFSNKKRREVEL